MSRIANESSEYICICIDFHIHLYVYHKYIYIYVVVVVVANLAREKSQAALAESTTKRTSKAKTCKRMHNTTRNSNTHWLQTQITAVMASWPYNAFVWPRARPSHLSSMHARFPHFQELTEQSCRRVTPTRHLAVHVFCRSLGL